MCVFFFFQLSHRLNYTSYIRPVCLPTHPVKPGADCISSGWGRTSSFGCKFIRRYTYSCGRTYHLHVGPVTLNNSTI